MKSALYAGSKHIRLAEHEPVEPGPGEVQVRVAYCGICGTDVHIYHGKMDARIDMPQPVGHEMSGVVQKVGLQVSGFAAGDHVTVRPLAYEDDESAWQRPGAHIRPGVRFMGIDTPGAFQYSWTVPADTLHKLPQNLPLDTAALTEPLAVACHDVRRGRVAEGEQVVVIGGGPIGMLIALACRAIGAEVLVSEINPHRLSLLRKMGIDTVDPSASDIEQVVADRTGGIGADVVFEVTGTEAGARTMTQLPSVRGRIVVVGIFSEAPAVDLFQFFWSELELLGARVYEAEDFDRAISLAASGTLPLDKLISKVVRLEDLEDAFREIDTGADLMKVLVKCSD